jgi:predicted DsbA family dithiol-disulfide isomerase
VELAADAGLDPAAARAALADDGLADEVRGDEREAAAIGITGVPFFVLNRRYAVSGAQSSDILLQALQRTWAETIEGAAPPAS